MEIGDVLCVKKTLYYHYAIYMGDGLIVHLKSNRTASGFSVQKTRVIDYVKNTYVKILSLDSFWKHFEKKYIITNAIKEVGTPGYNILTNNCAHFVCMCITGNRKFALLRMILKRCFIAKIISINDLFKEMPVALIPEASDFISQTRH